MSGFAVNFLALGLTGYLFSSIYPDGTPDGQVSASRRESSTASRSDFLDGVFGAT